MGYIVLPCVTESATSALSPSAAAALPLASRHGQIFKGIVPPGPEHRIDFSANPGDDLDAGAADQVKGAS
jgi:hypothetical protein